MGMRFHVLGLPHTVSSKEFNACAFTQKVVKFCEMMSVRGHHIIHYGHEDSKVDCYEHVTVITNKEWLKVYGHFDWRKEMFKFDQHDDVYKTFVRNAILEVGKRKQPKDFILPFWGNPMKEVCDTHNDMIVVEPGIGYAWGHFAPFKVFESYAAHSAYYNLESLRTCNQQWYDVVIPNYFNINDFEYYDKKEDYFLYLGRIYDGKGVHIAIDVALRTGIKLKVAGQGSLEAMGYKDLPPNIEYVGYADIEKRKKLMSKAKGIFVASLYNEPFAGVQIEAMLSGTPVISTDWGCFSELNIHGKTGFRCRTFEHFIWAVKNIDKIKSINCRTWAENFSYDKVGKMYEEYFSSLLNIYGSQGWYEPNDERTELDWLERSLPNA
jgi:glycosyltransferase involved in cell wall biosynthesis